MCVFSKYALVFEGCHHLEKDPWYDIDLRNKILVFSVAAAVIRSKLRVMWCLLKQAYDLTFMKSASLRSPIHLVLSVSFLAI